MAADNGRIAPSLGTGDVGRRIRTIRQGRSRGMSPDEACQAITKAGWPIKRPTLFQWENGHRSIPLAAVPYLAKAYGVDCEFIVGAMNCRKTREKMRK